MSKHQKIYWAFFSLALFFLAKALGSFWLGLMIAVFVYIGLLVFHTEKTVILTSCAFFFAFYSFLIQNKTFYILNRPYVQVMKSNVHKEKDKIICVFYIENVGNIPASNLKINFHQILNGEQTEEKHLDGGVVFPNQRYDLTFSFNGDVRKNVDEAKDFHWSIHYEIEYEGISTATYKTSGDAVYEKNIDGFILTGKNNKAN